MVVLATSIHEFEKKRGMKRVVLLGASLGNSSVDHCQDVSNKLPSLFRPAESICSDGNVCSNLFLSNDDLFPICTLSMQGCTKKRPLLCKDAYEASVWQRLRMQHSSTNPIEKHEQGVNQAKSPERELAEMSDEEQMDLAIKMSLEGLSGEYQSEKGQMTSVEDQAYMELSKKLASVFIEKNAVGSIAAHEVEDLSEEQQMKLAIAESLENPGGPAGIVYAEPGRVGIKNLQNTCYLASAIQVLGHSVRFLEMLSSTRFVRPNPVQEAFVRIIHEMWSERREPLDVKSLLKALHEFRYPKGAPRVAANRNAEPLEFTKEATGDAHEAIRIILGKLSDAARPLAASPNEEPTRIDELFASTAIRSFVCRGCKGRRNIEEKDHDIMLTIPKIKDGDPDVVSLYDCYRETVQSEELQGVECATCDRNQKASTRRSLTSGADVMLMVLGRFDYSGGKIHTKVRYPLTFGLNGKRYKLVGVVHHLGTTRSGGHYVSQFLSFSDWVDASDTHVHLHRGPVQTVSDTAYILVYDRIKRGADN